MKKFLGFVLAFCMVAMLSAMPMSALALNEDTDIKMNEHTPANINGDGDTNLYDLVVLAQFCAGWDVDCVEDACDPNNDGENNLNDVTHLAKFFAGWNVKVY